MSALDQLFMLDLRDELAAVARRFARPNAVDLAPRTSEQYITFHYSAVAYADRSRAAEIEHIKAEMRFHVEKDWGRPGLPAFAKRYMYDFVVLSDGGLVRTDGQRLQRWHCGNRTGNRASWSVHVLLGGAQDLTESQRASLFALFAALRIDSQIPRAHVISHCEWPVGDGQPLTSPTYQRQPGQSSCPGPVLHKHIAAYRAVQLPSEAAPAMWPGSGHYQARTLKWVYQAPDPRAKRAHPKSRPDRPFILRVGDVVGLSDLVAGGPVRGESRWAKLSDNRGFVLFRESDFEKVTP